MRSIPRQTSEPEQPCRASKESTTTANWREK